MGPNVEDQASVLLLPISKNIAELNSTHKLRPKNGLYKATEAADASSQAGIYYLRQVGCPTHSAARETTLQDRPGERHKRQNTLRSP